MASELERRWQRHAVATMTAGTSGRRARLSGVGLVIGLLLASVVTAHHSTANFDRDIRMEITGTVTRFQFTNPHSLIEMDVVDGSGLTQSYSVFATSKVVLLRYGWRPESVNVGDSIAITGHPDRNDPRFVYLTGIRFADGSEWSRSEILE